MNIHRYLTQNCKIKYPLLGNMNNHADQIHSGAHYEFDLLSKSHSFAEHASGFLALAPVKHLQTLLPGPLFILEQLYYGCIVLSLVLTTIRYH